MCNVVRFDASARIIRSTQRRTSIRDNFKAHGFLGRVCTAHQGYAATASIRLATNQNHHIKTKPENTNHTRACYRT